MIPAATPRLSELGGMAGEGAVMASDEASVFGNVVLDSRLPEQLDNYGGAANVCDKSGADVGCSAADSSLILDTQTK